MTNFTWTNATGGDWSTASNWNPMAVPVTRDNIMLPTLAGAYTSIDNIAFIDDINLSLGNNVTLIVAEGDTGVENINAFGTNSLFETQGNAIVSIGNGLGGTYAVDGPTASLDITGFNGVGTFDIFSGTATFGNNANLSGGNSFDFGGDSSGKLAITNSNNYQNGWTFHVTGFALLDTIALGTNVFKPGTYTNAYDAAAHTLTIPKAGGGSFVFNNFSTAAGAPTTFDVTGTSITDIACYARGTMIRTDRGEVPIEELSIGDRVVTLFGEARPIRWIGRRAYDARFVAGNRALLPVLIRQDALDDGVPRRDLYVSPKHALFLDDVLVPAEQLVNGVSIFRCETVATVEYFHIELDTHDIILAEGAPSETFVDCDNRFMFQNAGEFARLYPDCNAPTWAFCAPRVEEGDLLQHLWWRLDERLEMFGCTSTFDPDLHLVVDGVPVSADRVDDTVHVFRLQSPGREVRIVSRSSVPAELDAAFTDIRRLGVNVSRVVLSSDDVNIVVGCRDTSLLDGFHASEESHRWTDGDARIPAKFLACFDQDMTIEVHVLDYGLSYRTGQWEAERLAENADAVPVGGTRRRTA
jgi:hypothetical protein